MEAKGRLRAVKLVEWLHTGESTVTGSIEWTSSGWVVTGSAGWLLTEYNAGLVTADGLRQVSPDEGVLFLYAVWYSMRATYFSVELLDRHGQPIDREELLADLESLASI